MSCHVMKLVWSSIHLCVTKNVAPNPSSLSNGATNVRCDLTASSNVSTTSLSGIVWTGLAKVTEEQSSRIEKAKRETEVNRKIASAYLKFAVLDFILRRILGSIFAVKNEGSEEVSSTLTLCDWATN